MALDIYQPYDFHGNELRRAVLQNLPEAPPNPKPGQKYFDTTLNKEGTWNGNSWDYLGATEGFVTEVTGSAPITVTGGSTRTVSIEDATPSSSGAMSRADKAKLDDVEEEATSNSTDAELRARSSHTGSQAISTVSGLQSALDNKLASSAFTKSAVDAMGVNAATVGGATPGAIRDRATHTGTQPISTVTGLQGELDSKMESSARGVSNGVASLDGGGKVPANQLPALAITETYVVTDIEARDALSVQEGDVAIVQDRGDGQPKSFIYDGSEWQALLSPTDGVTEVTGGAGLDSTGGQTPTLSIANLGVVTAMLANKAVTEAKLSDAVVDKINGAGNRFANNIGDGSATEFTVTHNMNTRDVDVTVYRNSAPYDDVSVEVERPTVNTVTLRFSGIVPANNAFRVKVTS